MRRGRVPELGILLLAFQIFRNVGVANIPPVTLLAILLQVANGTRFEDSERLTRIQRHKVDVNFCRKATEFKFIRIFWIFGPFHLVKKYRRQH